MFGGGAAASDAGPEAAPGASSAPPASGQRAKYNDYLGLIAGEAMPAALGAGGVASHPSRLSWGCHLALLAGAHACPRLAAPPSLPPCPADRDLSEVDMFSIRRNFENVSWPASEAEVASAPANLILMATVFRPLSRWAVCGTGFAGHTLA